MSSRLGLVATLAALACCSKSEVKTTGTTDPGVAGKPTFTVFALAELRGQIGPCGCTSDPLGDLSRTAQLIEDARAQGPVLVVDAGSLLYSKSPVPAHLAAQEELKADLLARTYKEDLAVGALGLGPADLAQGVAKVRIPRQAANARDGVPTVEPAVISVGGTKVGVFGVIAADAFNDIKTGDPIAAGKQAATALRGQGARVIVALVQAANKRDAAQLVRAIGGIDVAIAGLGLEAPEPERVETAPQKLGDTWLVVPANRGQVIARIDVTLRDGDGPLVDAVGPAAAAARIAGIDRQLAALDADLAKFAADGKADPAFVAQKRTERTELAAQRDQLKRAPYAIPPRGGYLTLEQIRINKTRACSKKVQDAVSAYFAAAGDANVKAAANLPPPPVGKGQAGFSGGEACDDCHADAVAFWKKTPHAHAWKTIEERGQQFDFDCIGCHVTGWLAPGGSNLAHNDKLRDVQCEVCHGPASIHIAKGGEEKPSSVIRMPDEKLCATQCHTKEHSDTFELKAYLRDIVGPGHGEDLRKKLGDGPTGGQLRKAALDKAGRTLGARCIR